MSSESSTPAEKGGSEASLLGLQDRAEIIKASRIHDGDCGSPEVQIALLTNRILNLTEHCKENQQDKHSRQGLLKLVSKRKRLLRYLQGENLPRYQAVLKLNNLRK